ncbi:MAG: lysophospholipid acyltransferase family protein [Bacillota bacterium]|nr:lysophospholipid acyltransferase family protein [Bacillota bacterium]
MFYKFVIGAARFLVRLLFTYSTPNNSNVPDKGGFIICSNHSSNWDPIFIAISVRRRLSFMAKKELFKNKIFGILLSSLGAFPLDRSKNDVGAVKTAIKVLKDGNVLLIFPQGKRCKMKDEIAAKHGAIKIAIIAGVPILPVGITESHKLFRRVNVNIGKPIDYSQYKGTKLTDEDCDKLSSELMKEINKLVDGE